MTRSFIDWHAERERARFEMHLIRQDLDERLRASLRLCAEGERNIRTRELEASR